MTDGGAAGGGYEPQAASDITADIDSKAPSCRLVRLAVGGDLDLRHASLPRHVIVEDCRFDGEVVLDDADGLLVEFRRCHLPRGLTANRLRADTVIVEDCTAGSTLRFSAASIGRLQLDGTAVDMGKGGGLALDANVLTTTRSVTMKGFVANGRVRFIGASIGGQLNLRRAELTLPGASSVLSLHELTSARSVYLREAKIRGGVTFSGAHVGGRIDARDADIDACGRPSRMALDLNGTTIERSLQLQDAELRGALRGERLRVGTLVSLTRAHVHALAPATAGDGTVPSSAPEDNDPDDGRADDMSCTGLWLRGLVCMDIDLTRAALTGRNRIEDATVSGSVRADGTIICGRSSSLSMQGTSVGGEFRWRGARVRGADAEVDFRHMAVDRLADDKASWNAPSLKLRGMRYRSLPVDSDGWTFDERLRWLARPTFDRQLYDQMETFLRQQGLVGEARTVAIERESRRRSAAVNPLARVTGALSKWLTGHGYAPERAAALLAVVILLGGLMLLAARSDGAVTPDARCPADAPCFNAFLLSADTALPIVDLGYGDEWDMDSRGDNGWAYVVGYTMLTALGWTLATLAVAGLTRRAIRD